MLGLKELISRCKNNDRKAQEQLYRIFSAKLFGICLKYSSNRQEAEDNLQDGFVTIFKKISQYKNEGSFEGWMKRVLINTCLQKHREPKLYDIVNERILNQEEEFEVEEEDMSVDFLLSCVQALPERYRQVFNLYVMDGFSHKEIAKLLHISEGTSKSNLARARMALKEKIEKHQEITNNSAQLP